MNYYGKQQCLAKDWNNVKEITAEEIAYCIYTHNLDIDNTPKARLSTVTKELVKLHNIDKKEQEHKLIEIELTMYKYTNNNKCFTTSREFEDYYIDTDLFETSLEAELAMNELKSYYSNEVTKTSEYDYEYKNSTHSRDIKRLQETMEKVKQKYINLGGLESEFFKPIPPPDKGTLKEDIYQHREVIQKRFIDIGVSPTRANKIAIAITAKVYQLLK